MAYKDPKLNMSNLLQRILLNVKTRIMFIIYMSIIVMSGFFIIYGYFNQLKLYEEKEYEVLAALASSLAINIDGDLHENLVKQYPWKDQIKTIQQDSTYYYIHEKLARAHEINNLNTPIYTIVYDKEETVFYYIVRSDTNVYYRHSYEMFPDILLEEMETGGIIPKYSTENGEWLSAFHPIRNSKGEVVAILEADLNFGVFRQEVFDTYKNQALISLVVIILLALLLIPYVRKILNEDDKVKGALMDQTSLIQEKNRDLTASINYASQIQESMLPDIKQIRELIPDSFVFYKPRDIVSGDFYWFKKWEGKVYLAVVDCIGHGIPGALMSMIAHTRLSSIITSSLELGTDEILTKLDKSLSETLSNDQENRTTKNGLDAAICKIDLNKMTLECSGALMDVIKISKDNIAEYKGNRFAIGSDPSYPRTELDKYVITINKGDSFYMYSDGYQDQFGGKNDKKYMSKNLKNLLLSIQGLSPDKKLEKLDKDLSKWQGELDQVDDITIVGFSF